MSGSKGCETCKGRMTFLGLGSIRMDCETCQGTGYVEEHIEVTAPSKLKLDDKQLTDTLVNEEIKVSDADVTIELSKKYDQKKKKQKEG